MNFPAALLPNRRLGLAARTAARPLLILVAVIVLVLPAAFPASAYWGSTGSTAARAATSRLGPPTNVTAPAQTGGTVAVEWTASKGDLAPEGYFVTRSPNADGSAGVPACLTDPARPTVATSCADAAMPGIYYYTVTAVYQSWTSTGLPSGQVTVSRPSILGAAASYSVLAQTAVVNTSATTVSGDLGVSPGTAITGFGPGTAGGDIHAGDDHAQQAQAALAAAITTLGAGIPDAEITGDLGGRTFTAGTYSSTAALALTGVLTLDAQGNPDAVFVFQANAALDTAAGSSVVLANGARASNVFWVAAGAAGTGANSSFAGSILAGGAITLGNGTELIGRALSRGTVTLANNTIRFTQALPPSLGINGSPAATTQDTTPTISGASNAPPGSPVSVAIAGQSLHTEVGADGTWSAMADGLAAGIHSVEAKVRDAAGNGSAAHLTLTIEVSPPRLELGLAGSYSILAATGAVNTGSSFLSGDLGVFPSTAISGFEPENVAGSIHAGDPHAGQAQTALLTAINDGSSRVPHTEITGDLGGRTLHTGVHHSTAAMAITGTLTLDAQGDPDAVFLFQTDAAFNTAASSSVVLANGAQAGNVFWVAGGAVGTGANSVLTGSVLARGAITLGASTALAGQALSLDTITLAANTLTGTVPHPAERASVPIQPTPTTDPSTAPAPVSLPPNEPTPEVAP